MKREDVKLFSQKSKKEKKRMKKASVNYRIPLKATMHILESERRA